MDQLEFEVSNEDKVVGPVTLSTLQQGWYQGHIPVNSWSAPTLGTQCQTSSGASRPR